MLRQVHDQVRLARNRQKVVISLVFVLAILCSGVFAFASDDRGDPVPDPTEVHTEVLRISAQDTSGFHAVILGLLGDYNPIVKDYTYQTTQGYYSHSIDIQPDWSWICSAAIFALIIFCLFRLIGGIFSWKR